MLKPRKLPDLYTLKPSDLKKSLGGPGRVFTEPDIPEELGVLCINCGNYVFSQEIEAHSLSCLRVQVSELENEEGLSNCKRKFTKLEAFLSRSLPSLSRPGDQNYLKILIRLCAKLKSVETSDELPVINQVGESLASLLATFRGKESLKLYGERLKALVFDFEREVTTSSLKNTVDTLKQQVEFYKQKATNLEKSIMSARTHYQSESSKALIDNLDSEVGSRRSETSDFTSISSQSETSSALDFSFDRPIQQDVSADLKRYFYSQCLAIKLTFPQRSVAHQVPINLLFRQVVDQRIPVDNWPEYIRSKLSKAAISARGPKPTGSVKRMTTLHELSGEEESDKEI
mmetsp:Transcript_21889/g.39920  ORF Transcript_21889/g.39920 Transcript_21889/m.39920 type:complete len:344 (-) Transcript_21889:970-2001(-)